jgi:hypothetical protein
MDISKLNVKASAEQGATLQLRNPFSGEELFNDDKSPMTISLLGRDSEPYRRTSRATANKNLKAGRAAPKVEKFEQDGVELLAAVTTGWNIQFGNEMLEFSPAKVRDLYADPEYRWVYEQVDEFVAERSNFLKNA